MSNALQTLSNRLSILDQEITTLTDQLRPASDDAVKSKLLSLQRSGLQWPPGIDAKRAPEIYAYALKAAPTACLKLAVEKIIQGEVEGVELYIPTPPALAAMVRKLAAPMIEDAARVRSIREAMTPPGETADPEEQDRQLARIREMHQGFKDYRAALKAEEEAARPKMSEAEANRFYRNKEFPAEQPRGEKWDDDKWHQQQKENEYGEEARSGDEDRSQGLHPGRSEGQHIGDEGDGEPGGDRDGGERRGSDDR
jgi:hypothetical protein